MCGTLYVYLLCIVLAVSGYTWILECGEEQGNE